MRQPHGGEAAQPHPGRSPELPQWGISHAQRDKAGPPAERGRRAGGEAGSLPHRWVNLRAAPPVGESHTSCPTAWRGRELPCTAWRGHERPTAGSTEELRPTA